VQNFNENLSILAAMGLYILAIDVGLSTRTTMVLFGLFVGAAMGLVILRHRANQRRFDAVALIGDTHHGDTIP